MAEIIPVGEHEVIVLGAGGTMKILKIRKCGSLESQTEVKIVDSVKGLEIRESKIILTGPDHQKVLLIILLAKDYELCFFDLK